MLTHRNKKPYECKAEGCGKSYCDARSLRRHMENHHSSLVMTAVTTTTSAAAQNQSNSTSSNHSTGTTSGTAIVASTITNPSLSPAPASGKILFSSFIFSPQSFKHRRLRFSKNVVARLSNLSTHTLSIYEQCSRFE